MIKTGIDDFYLKYATADDSAIIFGFISKLAIYEKLENDLIGSIELLKDNVFNKKQAEVLIAYYKDEPVGFALYFTTFSTFTCKGNLYLEDLYIDESLRNNGFGKEIFYQLAKICQERDYERFEWVCLDWNMPSRKFYENVIEAKAQSEWVRYRLDKKGIDHLVTKFD
jgi:GNAT superfamily N-acetyltransferase